MLGLVINQLQHPGAPFLFLFGFGSGPMDMRTMQSLFAHPTEVQIQGGSCDIVPEEIDRKIEAILDRARQKPEVRNQR